jgi:hypothetical protein
MSAVLAFLLAVAAGTGVFVPNLYAHFITEPAMLAGLWIQDLFSLLAIPILAGAIWGTQRGSRRAFVVWCAVLVFVGYYYSFYVFGYIYTVLYPLYLAILGLSIYSLIGLLAGANLREFAAGVDARMPVRVLAVILLSALLFVPLWAGLLLHDIQAQQPRVTALVFVLDLCFLLPALTIAAVQVWQRRPFGYLLAGILLIKAAVSGILLTASTLYGAPLGLPLIVEELAMYCVLTFAGLTGVYLYMRHLHGQAAPVATSGRRDSMPTPANGD